MGALNSNTMDTLTRFAVISLQQLDYSVVFRTRSWQLLESAVCYILCIARVLLATELFLN